MTLIITTNSDSRASQLAEDILHEVKEGNIETWKYKVIRITIHRDGRSSGPRRWIYHDTEQTKEENKIIWFLVTIYESDVIFRAYYPDGVELTRPEELFHLGRLSEMLICNFSGRFSAIQIEW